MGIIYGQARHDRKMNAVTDVPQRASAYAQKRSLLGMEPDPLKDWLRAERGDPDFSWEPAIFKEIERRAYLAYQRRLDSRKAGGPIGDWLLAEMEFYDAWVCAPIFVAFERYSVPRSGGDRNESFRDFLKKRVDLGLSESDVYPEKRLFAFEGSQPDGFGFTVSPDLDLSMALSLLFSAGGLKLIVDLLLAWIKERHDRVIKIKVGATELEIHGAASEREIRKLLEILEGVNNKSPSWEVASPSLPSENVAPVHNVPDEHQRRQLKDGSKQKRRLK